MTVPLAQLAQPLPHQLTATWRNTDATQTIYVTDDPALNVVTLTLDNGLGTTVVFPPGQPVAYGELPDDQSAVYLFFSGLIPNEDVARARLAADGWSAQCFTDPNTELAYIAAAPQAAVTVDDGASLTFTITDLIATQRSGGGNVTISLAGAQGVTADQAELSVFVNVATPPDAGGKSLDLIVDWADRDEVYTGSDQTNDLLLVITNPGREPLIPGGYDSWGDEPPEFRLTFVYGSGRGALTDLEAAGNFAVNLDAQYGNAWKQVRRGKQGEFPYWVMQPDPNGGGEVLGTGEDASVAFSVTGIVTTLPPGVTLAYLSYSNIPGYNDGFFAIEVVKVDPIVLRRFESTFAATGPYRTGPTDVTLSFDIVNATYVTIVGTDYARRTTSAEFADTLHVSLTESTAFTLLAYNNKTGQQIARPLNVQLPTPPVVIDAFFSTAPGLRIAPNQTTETQAVLEMRVKNATTLFIPGTGWSKRVDQQPFHGYADVPIRTSTTFTLVAINEVTGEHAFAACAVDVSPDPLRSKVFTGLVTLQSDGTPTPVGEPYGWSVARGGDYGEYTLAFGPGTFNGGDVAVLVVMPVSYPNRFGSAAIYQAARPGDGSVAFSIGLQAQTRQMTPSGFYFLAFQPEAYPGQ